MSRRCQPRATVLFPNLPKPWVKPQPPPPTEAVEYVLLSKEEAPYLPQEVLDLVIGFCDGVTLKTLRLSSSQCLPAATPKLFEEVHMISTDASLQKAKLLGKDELLSKHVKKFVYHCDIVPDYPKDVWRYISTLSPRQTRTQVDAAYDRFQGLLDQQQSFSVLGLQYTLGMFENLEDVEARTMSLEEVKAGLFPPIWRTTFSTILHSPKHWAPLCHQTAIPSLSCSQNPAPTSLGSSAVKHAWIERGEPHLNMLYRIFGGWTGRVHQPRSLNTFKVVLDGLASMRAERFSFFPIHRLVLHLSQPIFPEKESFDSISSKIWAFMSLCPELEALSLSFNGFNRGFSGPENVLSPRRLLDSGESVGHFQWPELKEIELKGMSTTEHDLMHFLLRHAGTLKHLRLEDITFVDGEQQPRSGMPNTWMSVFCKLAKNFILKSFDIRDLHDSNDTYTGHYDQQLISRYVERGIPSRNLTPEKLDRLFPKFTDADAEDHIDLEMQDVADTNDVDIWEGLEDTEDMEVSEDMQI